MVSHHCAVLGTVRAPTFALRSQANAIRANNWTAEVSVVDMDGFDPATMTWDGIHPQSEGRAFLSSRWSEAIAPDAMPLDERDCRYLEDLEGGTCAARDGWMSAASWANLLGSERYSTLYQEWTGLPYTELYSQAMDFAGAKTVLAALFGLSMSGINDIHVFSSSYVSVYIQVARREVIEATAEATFKFVFGNFT